MPRMRIVIVGAIIMTLIALTLGTLKDKGGNKSIESPSLVGDIDNSGRVDGFDLGRFGVAEGTHPGDPQWDSKLDLNNDGVLDGKDLEIIHKNFGKINK